jgi:hypothetical protein
LYFEIPALAVDFEFSWILFSLAARVAKKILFPLSGSRSLITFAMRKIQRA